MDVFDEIIEKPYHAKANFRYERKFTQLATNRAFPLNTIKSNTAFFREIFEPRQINNIYFDSQGLKFYKANVMGLAERKKVRIRWYGETFGKIEHPVLEFKIKHGLVGDKWSWKLPNFEIGENFDIKTVFENLKKADLPKEILAEILDLQPKLLNSYKRTYFLSANQKFRLTFDEDLIYRKITPIQNHFLESYKTPQDFIIELKYGLENDANANQISRQFPVRLDKSSKYVNGVDLISEKN